MLKQLRLQLDLKKKRSELSEFTERQSNYKKRSKELEKALEEAQTDDDIKVVEDSLTEFEKEKDINLDSKISTLSEEISKIESDLKELNEKSAESENEIKTDTQKRSENKNMEYTTHQVREMVRNGEYYKRSEVKDFYEQIRNIRAVTGSELTVPEVTTLRIYDIIGDYCTLYPLVDKIQLKGKLRILIDVDTAPAEWLEDQTSLDDTDVGTIGYIDFDGYTLGKLVAVDNAILQDSIINLDSYIIKKIARALGLALDLGVLKGNGTKKPTGILTGMSSDNKVTVATEGLFEIMKNISLIDTGEDSVGEIVCVMKRSTYYDKFLKYTINVDSSGNIVGKLPNLSTPDLLGLRVVFNQNMDANQVLFGDFSKYTLVTREGINIARSEHAKFKENQTAFRGIGRFDGKVTNPKSFALVTIGEDVS